MGVGRESRTAFYCATKRMITERKLGQKAKAKAPPVGVNKTPWRAVPVVVLDRTGLGT
jgi:hypothetical protein